jgi:hypothetical protein
MSLIETTRIYFRVPFDIKYKDYIVEQLIKNSDLEGMQSDPSWEGGINLPLTQEWFTLNLKNKQYLKYHDSRQFRFISDNNNKLTGLRCKDEINYFTVDEVDKIKKSLNEIKI